MLHINYSTSFCLQISAQNNPVSIDSGLQKKKLSLYQTTTFTAYNSETILKASNVKLSTSYQETWPKCTNPENPSMRCPTSAGSTVGEKSSPPLMIHHLGAAWGHRCRHGLWYQDITEVHLKTGYNFTNLVDDKIIFSKNIKLVTGKESAVFFFFLI